MKPQDLIYSRVQLPSSQFEEQSKLFVVKAVDPATGAITAFKLTSKIQRKNQDGCVYLKKDDVNQLRYSSVIQTDREFIFPADWDMRVMRGHVDDATFGKALAAQEQYKKNTPVHVVQVEQPGVSNVDALRDKITELQQNFVRDPQQFLEYLAFKSRFYHYSPRNSLMIYAQNPYSTFVGSRTYFKMLGYTILPDQARNGIEILRPERVEFFRREGGEQVKVMAATREEQRKIAQKEIQTFTKTYYYPADVYDISQTDCPPSSYPKIFDMGDPSTTHRAAIGIMTGLAQAADMPVRDANLPSISLKGYFDREAKEIVLNSRLDDTQRLGVLCHEYAHGLLHQTSSQPREVKEFEAECLAYMIAEKFELPERAGSVEYIIAYLREAGKNPDFNLDHSLNRINKQLRYVGEQLDKAQANAPELTQRQEQSQMLDNLGQLPGVTAQGLEISENFMQNL